MYHFRFASLSFLAVTLSLTNPLHSEPPPAQIDLGKFQQATQIDNVVVPVPAEIFLVLDKIGTPN